MVRYTKGGGESCAVAVRIARGTTGKDKILFSGYHGWHDWYQSANYLVDPESGEFPFAGIEPTGVPKALAGTAIPFIYEDIDNLRQLFEENKGEVAAVMMEPMRSERPKDGYLEAVKDLCHANDALLIFDEVSSGWRISLGSAQEWLGITPGHVGLRQGHVQRLPDGLCRRLPRGDGAGRPHVHFQLLLERQHRPRRVGHDDQRAQAAKLDRVLQGVRRQDGGRSPGRRRFGRHLRPGHGHSHRPDVWRSTCPTLP